MQIRSYRNVNWAAVREIYDLAKPDELRNVVDASLIPPLDADPEMSLLFRRSQIFVMEDAARVVGFVGTLGRSIAWLFVHPNHRRKGVGRALVREIIARLDGPITLNVATANTTARALYESIGFVLEHEFMGHFKGHPCQVARLRYEARI